MKFLILLLISLTANAQNWMAVSVIQSHGVSAHSLKSECDKSGEQCLDVGESPEAVRLGMFNLSDVMGDDHSKPVWEPESQVESCSGESECGPMLMEKVCPISYEKFIDQDFSKVYCTKVIGYQQKVVGKSFAINQEAYNSFKSSESTKANLEKAIGQARKLRDCGERVMALMMVRNSSKNLTTAQKKKMVADNSAIKDLLESGSLPGAKEEILAKAADGVLVTEEDKLALAAEIDKCQAN